MPEKAIPFVITDRRKFNPDGEARAEATTPETPPHPTAPQKNPDPDPENVNTTPGSIGPAPDGPESEPHKEIASTETTPAEGDGVQDMPPPPTAEQMEQSRVAYQATAERLDLAVRAANPGLEHAPPMTFEQLVQSIYMQAILQLGGGTQQGQQPQVDILGARQSIDMLGVLDEKTKGNLSENEQALLSSALFEIRLAFLEITQALARQAQQRATTAPPPVAPGGPRIVR